MILFQVNETDMTIENGKEKGKCNGKKQSKEKIKGKQKEQDMGTG